MSFARVLPVLCALAAFGTPARAQCADESRLRSFESPYSASATLYGTATGFASDRVTLRNAHGQVVVSRTIAQWQSNPRYNGVVVVDGVVQHSGGQTSIRFWYGGIHAQHPALAGGTAEILRSSGCLVDRDRLY